MNDGLLGAAVASFPGIRRVSACQIVNKDEENGVGGRVLATINMTDDLPKDE